MRMRLRPSEKAFSKCSITERAKDEHHSNIPGGRKYGFLCHISSTALLAFFTASVFIKTQIQVPPTKATVALRRPVNDQDDKQCTIWLAPSSLKGNPGFGVFTTRNISKGENVLGGPDGISIPIIDYNERDVPRGQLKNAWIKVWDNFWWGRGVPDHVNYEAPTDVIDFQIALGALPNHHCMLHSLHHHYPDPPYDDSLANRFKDPGAGAFSYSMGREFTVNRDVEAGEELFLDYGYCRHGEDNVGWTDHISMPDDYEKAAKLVWIWLGLDQNQFKYNSSGYLTIAEGKNELVTRLLPRTKKELEEIKASVKSRHDLPMYLARHQGLNARNSDWIRSHGICLENLVPQKSTLPQAGQGGFAQHFVRKGDIVVPAPLLQIMDKEVLALYNNKGKRIGTQLLINYCMQHPKSSLLLCPDTNAVLINHCSTRTKQCGRDGPNAEVRWSSGWDPTSDSWRTLSLMDISRQPGRFLSFEIVALRDIRPGDEVFIDYGKEWEAAWDKHVAEWNPPNTIDAWITAKEANKNSGEVLEEFVSENLVVEMENPHLFIGCQYWGSDQDMHEVYQEKDTKWDELSDEELLKRFADDGKRYAQQVGYLNTGYTNHFDKSHWPCSVLKREPGGTYTVRIHQSRFHDSLPWNDNGMPRYLTNYPREAMHYFVKPGRSDQQLPGVFRQPIGIPDDMFPEHWKNLKD